MENADSYFVRFRLFFEKEAPHYLAEFDSLVKRGDAMDVFNWLNDLSRRGCLPKDMEDLLTDFFYSIH